MKTGFCVAWMLLASAVFAQDVPAIAVPETAAAPASASAPDDDKISAVVPKPPEEPAAAIPPVQVTPPVASYFPALPPSRPCKRLDITGIWVLEKVYENPAGQEAQNFAREPFQYAFFRLTSEYRELKQPRAENSVDALWPQLTVPKTKDMQQFVVHESGIVYFYKDSVADGAMACFIVANAQEPFQTGQMLLMPPVNADGSLPATRMVKVYRQLLKLPKQNSGANKNRKKKPQRKVRAP
jgi:hypothetical protein